MSEQVSILILDFNRPEEGKTLLLSLRKFANFNKEIIYMCNGGESDYAHSFYKEGLIDTLIVKRNGRGGGWGQTDLFKSCNNKYAIFLQVDHALIQYLSQQTIDTCIKALNDGFKCIDLNGDQSGRGIWTDRAHLINVDFFNSLGPFPNFGPGLDNGKWNEQHLQEKFKENGYRIAHIKPTFFLDAGKWSVRQAGNGLFKHRCDLKTLYVLKQPTYKTEVYPPLNEAEWGEVLSGNWPKEGKIPEQWKEHSFKFWD